MEDIKQRIISVLKEKGSELSTAEILLLVCNEYKALKDQGKYNEARQLHRRVLYHINMLMRERIIRFEKYGENGQKYFSINVGEGEQIYRISPTKYKKEVIGEKPLLPAMPIEGYEKEGIIMKYEQDTWMDRLNSAIIMCKDLKNQKEMLELIRKVFPTVNDSICLDNFEHIINKNKSINQFLKLDKECDNYGKKINCIIHVSKLNKGKFLAILDKITDSKLRNIDFIYKISEEDNKVFIGKVLSKYAEEKKKIFICNADKCESPWFTGRAGIYNFDDEEWRKQDKPTCVVCSQSSVIVDVRKFYETYGMNMAQFRDLLMNISKSFLAINPVHRKKLRRYFGDTIHSQKPYEHDFLELSRNYIRFWNFGLLQQDIDQSKVLDIIGRAKDKVQDFCDAEDRIYNSCGMSIRFKIVLSSAFRKSEEGLSPAKYKKIEVNGLDDLRDLKISEEINNIMKVSRLFDGGNRIGFHRNGSGLKGKNLANEIFFILNNYKLRFFSYNFE